MEKIALVSVVMPVRNMQKTVGTAIESILSQTYVNLEFIILDDGSTDQTLAVVRRFSDPRIRLVADSKQLGIAFRLNQGIDLAQGSYLARMDADDISLPNRLERQVAFLRKSPETDLIGCSILLLDATGNPVGERLFPSAHSALTAQPFRGFLIAHPTWMGRIEWFKRWKYCDVPRYEDQDLLLRAYSTSRYANLPEILLHYRIGPSSLLRKSLAWRGRCLSFINYFIKDYYYIKKRK